MLIFVGFLEEKAEAHREPAPRRLFASYLCGRMEYPEDVSEITRRSLLCWRVALTAKLEQVRDLYPRHAEVDLPALADGLSAAVEGGYVMAKALGDPKAPVAQFEMHKRHLELLFGPQ